MKIILNIFILILVFNLYGQNNNNNNNNSLSKLGNNIFPPTPESQSLIKNFEYDVSLNKGVPSISYPLFNQNFINYDLNLYFSYNASGIKVDEIASSIGLGWSLNGVGKITRVVKGLPDDLTSIGYMYNSKKVNDIDHNDLLSHNFLTQVTNKTKDFEPDIFYLDLGNRSVKFVWNQSLNQFFTISHEDIKFEYINDNGIKKWIITDEYGIKYYFGKSKDNLVTAVDETLSQEVIQITHISSIIPDDNFYNNINTWHLLDIEFPNSNIVNFRYNITDNYTTLYKINDTESKMVQMNVTRKQCSDSKQTLLSKIFYSEKKITEIQSKNFRVKFEYNNQLREDTNSKKLNNVKVYNSNNKLVKIFNLNHTYSIATDALKYQEYESTPEKRKKRLILSAVSESDGNEEITTQYQYNPKLLPSRLSSAQDHWGYYNEKLSNQTLVPQVYSYGTLTGNADRSVYTDATKAQILEKIILPTKGIIVFNYESNEVIKNGIASSQDLRNFHGELIDRTETFARNENFKVPGTNNYTKNINISNNIYGNISITSTVTGCEPGNNMSISCNYTISLRGLDPTNNHLYFDYQNMSSTSISNIPPGNYKLYATYNEPGGFGNPSDGNPDFFFLLKYKEAIENQAIGKSEANLKVGGLRIANIKYFHNNTIIKHEKFSYNNFTNDINYNLNNINNDIGQISNLSSGLILNFPEYINFDLYSCGNVIYSPTEYIDLKKFNITSTPLNDLATINGSGILYTNVTKEIIDGNKIIKEEFIFNPFPFSHSLFNNNAELTLGNNAYSISPINRFDLGGEPKVIRKFDQNRLIFEQINEYERIQKMIFKFGLNAITIGKISTFNPNMNGDLYNYVLYSLDYSLRRLKSTTTKEIDKNGNILTKIENFDYSSYTPTKIIETRTQISGDEYINKTFYPKDIINSTSLSKPLNSTEILHYTKMIEKNFLGIPVQNDVFQNSTLVSSERTNFKIYNSNLLLPHLLKTMKGETNDYLINGEYVQYDTKGNILWYKINEISNNSIIWGYDDSYPVAKLDNISYSEIPLSLINEIKSASNDNNDSLLEQLFSNLRNLFPNKAITCYIYDPLVGVKSIINPNGTKTTYQYDSFNRLKSVKDHHGNILNQTEYNYKH